MDRATYARRSRAVADAFVAAYPDHLRRRLGELGVGGDDDRVEAAIEEGRRRLADSFDTWVELAPMEQHASPLEMFREALAGPTAALRNAGVAEPDRDDVQRRSLPGDVYDLTPPTSRDLGEEVLFHHVAWGVARAEAVAGVVPAVPDDDADDDPASRSPVGAVAALVATDLMDRTRIVDTADRTGYRLEVWRNPGAVAGGLEEVVPAVAFVDLRHGAAEEAIRMLVEAGVRTVAFGPHVDDMAQAAARSLGATEVLPRSRFFARLASLFPTPV